VLIVGVYIIAFYGGFVVGGGNKQKLGIPCGDVVIDNE
jgi:hypothetical protein